MSAYELWHVEVEYTAGVWTDITADVDSMTAPVYATNGTTAEVAGDPGSLTLVLHNVGFKYTPANALSAFALSTGMGIRFFDLIGGNRVYTFTGFIEFPEVASVNVSMNQDQTIQVSAVDQLSLWERSQTFVSTLGAHIMGSTRNGALRGYWPMKDETLPVAPAVGVVAGEVIDPNRQGVANSQAPAVNVQSGGTPPGDDGAESVQIVYGFSGSTNTNGPYFDMRYPLSVTVDDRIPLAAGQVATLVVWVNMTSTTNVTLDLTGLYLDTLPSGGGWLYSLFRSADAVGSHWHGSYYNGSFWTVDSTNGSSNATERWYALGIRWGHTPNVIELWVDDARYTGTFTEAVTSAKVAAVSPSIYGSIAHVQLHVGAPADFDFTDFTAQRAVGLTGLERQTTGDRIDTLARYAGKTDALLTQVDPGQSIMATARLAGLTVAQAMYEARDTEQGDLYIDGTGLTTFADRRTLLNI